MKVEDFYKRLSVGELSNLKWGENGKGTIQKEKQEVTLDFINDGLAQLYAHFILKRDFVFLELKEMLTRYVLNSKHAYTNEDSDEIKYIRDTPSHRFRDDVVKIMAVTASNGYKCHLNNDRIIWSIYTPEYNVLSIPHPVNGLVLAVTYQASHPKLTSTDDEISIPPILEEALRCYVAFQIHSNMNTQEAVGNGQKYLQQFQNIVQSLDEQGTLQEEMTLDLGNKFETNGWV